MSLGKQKHACESCLMYWWLQRNVPLNTNQHKHRPVLIVYVDRNVQYIVFIIKRDLLWSLIFQVQYFCKSLWSKLIMTMSVFEILQKKFTPPKRPVQQPVSIHLKLHDIHSFLENVKREEKAFFSPLWDPWSSGTHLFFQLTDWSPWRNRHFLVLCYDLFIQLWACRDH